MNKTDKSAAAVGLCILSVVFMVGMFLYTKYKYPSPRVRTPAQIKAAIAAHKSDVFLNELSDAGISSPVPGIFQTDSRQSARDKLAAYKAEKAKIAAAPEIEALLTPKRAVEERFRERSEGKLFDCSSTVASQGRRAYAASAARVEEESKCLSGCVNEHLLRMFLIGV